MNMKPPAPHEESADESGGGKLTCALCGGNLIRIPRRASDRLLNLFVPVHRYRCSRFTCQWTGNLRIDSRTAKSLET